ncbi:MAG: carbohydrate binding domain-containing protein [Xanthomonadales bacterium]|nr:carbohydrate binding domain-containing protein [Xanthomonadales bacterium]MCC6560949.1 carbohydrate binding domain-containing protein [Xanthomonadales bacterium]
MKTVLTIALLAVAVTAVAKPESLLRNGSFETANAKGKPEGWNFQQHAGVRAYDFTLDDLAFEGKHSLRLTRLQKQVWGKVVQNIPANDLIGKTVEFSVRARGEAVGKRGFSVGLGGFAGSTMLQHVKSERVTGTSDWRKYTLRIEVPEGSSQVMVGVTLDDKGTVWIDDARLRVVKSKS